MFGVGKINDLDVEAVSDEVDEHGDRHSESASIEQNNNFLIKGLNPGKTYKVFVSNSNDIIAIPKYHKIVMGKKDYKDVFFHKN